MTTLASPGDLARAGSRLARAGRWLAPLLVAACTAAAAAPEAPVALRVDSLVVAPPHSPPVYVAVKNLGQQTYRGTVTVKVPQGWAYRPPQIDVSLAPGETKRVAFTVTRGTLERANRYPIEAAATGEGTTVTRRQEVACTSAPYFKPTIDGDPADWKDAIPVTFTTAGKRTTISTYWNRRQLALLVAVEEDKLVPPGGAGEPDAVQVAVSPQGTTTGDSSDGRATRYEFLLTASGQRRGKCYLLAQPGTPLAECAKPRALGPLAYNDAQVVVSRKGGVTYYECELPFKLMRGEIRPSEGREFCLSVLVHDPDGTGIRDWGQAAGLWESQRNRLAWSLWPGARWGPRPPMDNKTPWGLCSSKY